MNFTSCTSIPLISLSFRIYPLPLQSPPTKENKKYNKKNNLKKSWCGSCGFCTESLVWFQASEFCYTINTRSHQDSSWISCCYHVSWRTCSFGSVELASSHAPEDHRWCRCWSGPTQSPASGPEWQLSWSASQLSCTRTINASSGKVEETLLNAVATNRVGNTCYSSLRI